MKRKIYYLLAILSITVNAWAALPPDINSREYQKFTTDSSGNPAIRIILPDGAGATGGGWTDDGTTVRLTSSGDNVGIGTTAAGSQLTVGSTGQATVDSSGNIATSGTFNKLTLTQPASAATLTISNGKVATISNTLTFAGTDSTVMTFPSTSATIARTDAANTFTGHQTIEGVTSTGATGTGKFVFDGTPTLVTPVLGAATGTSLAVTGNITSSGGSIGIGSTSPSQALDVAGNININGNSRRIYGNFSGSGFIRPSMQDASGGSTKINILAGGSTGTNAMAGLLYVPTSDTTNYPYMSFEADSTGSNDGSAGVFFNSAKAGSGTTLPFNFQINSATVLNIATTSRVGIGTTVPTALLNVEGGGVIINDNSANGLTALRVEGDTDANLIYTDGTNDRVGFGTATPSNKVTVSGNMDVTGNVGIGSTAPNGSLDIRNTTTNMGWTVVTGANTACNTTCVSACVMGEDTSVVGTWVNCTDATADICLCAGTN